MARDLGISASYLNLVERNQRPLTTQLVLKLAAIYELDLRELHGDREAERVAELTEIFSDPVFGKMPSATVFADLVNGYPDIVSAFSSLYSAYRKAQGKCRPRKVRARGADRRRRTAAIPLKRSAAIFMRATTTSPRSIWRRKLFTPP